MGQSLSLSMFTPHYVRATFQSPEVGLQMSAIFYQPEGCTGRCLCSPAVSNLPPEKRQ